MPRFERHGTGHKGDGCDLKRDHVRAERDFAESRRNHRQLKANASPNTMMIPLIDRCTTLMTMSRVTDRYASTYSTKARRLVDNHCSSTAIHSDERKQIHRPRRHRGPTRRNYASIRSRHERLEKSTVTANVTIDVTPTAHTFRRPPSTFVISVNGRIETHASTKAQSRIPELLSLSA